MASDPSPSATTPSDETKQGMNSWWARFAEWNPSLLTTVTLALATGLRVALTPLWGSGYTFITFYPAIMFIAVANGWRHGIVATLVSSAISILLFLDIHTSPSEQQMALALFITSSVIIVSLTEAVTRARLHALAETSVAKAQEQLLRQEIEARIKAEESVRASERQMQFVTDHAPVLIAQCGTDGRYRFVNRQYAQLFGRTPEELIGLHPREVLGDTNYRQAEPFMQDALAGRTYSFRFDVLVGQESPGDQAHAEVEDARHGRERAPSVAVDPEADGRGHGDGRHRRESPVADPFRAS